MNQIGRSRMGRRTRDWCVRNGVPTVVQERRCGRPTSRVSCQAVRGGVRHQQPVPESGAAVAMGDYVVRVPAVLQRLEVPEVEVKSGLAAGLLGVIPFSHRRLVRIEAGSTCDRSPAAGKNLAHLGALLKRDLGR